MLVEPRNVEHAPLAGAAGPGRCSSATQVSPTGRAAFPLSSRWLACCSAGRTLLIDHSGGLGAGGGVTTVSLAPAVDGWCSRKLTDSQLDWRKASRPEAHDGPGRSPVPAGARAAVTGPAATTSLCAVGTAPVTSSRRGPRAGCWPRAGAVRPGRDTRHARMAGDADPLAAFGPDNLADVRRGEVAARHLGGAGTPQRTRDVRAVACGACVLSAGPLRRCRSRSAPTEREGRDHVPVPTASSSAARSRASTLRVSYRPPACFHNGHATRRARVTGVGNPRKWRWAHEEGHHRHQGYLPVRSVRRR